MVIITEKRLLKSFQLNQRDTYFMTTKTQIET